jgi:hypothetical protein
MQLFPRNRREYTPDETPLGPRTYPRVGGKPSLLASIGRRRWWWISGVAGVLLIIVLIVLLMQRSGRGSLIDQVALTIQGPDRVTLGSDVSYDVTYANNSADILTGARLLVIYPQGFSFTIAEPKADNVQGTEFTLGDIAPGTAQTIRLNGRLTGAVKTEQLFIARLQFLPQGSSEVLQIESSFTTTIETAAFTFAVEAPATLLPNNELVIDIDLENNEATPLANVQVRATYPGGFDFQSATPAPTKDENIWTVDSLGIGEKKEFQIKGLLGGNIDEVKRFILEAGFLDENGNFLKQTEVEKIVKLIQPAVTVVQAVDGKTELTIGPDDELEYTIGFQNTGPAGLTNLVLDVAFNPIGAWDTKTLVIMNGGAVKEGNIIRWDGVKVPELRALEPGQSGEVSFTVRAPSQITVDDPADKHFATTTTPTIKIGTAAVTGNPIVVKYRAGISAGATSSVISGPNPPQVGQATVYEVSWTLTNLYNDLTGARFVGAVPTGAEFVPNSGHVSAGEDLVYNVNTRQILWNIGKVPSNVGKLQPNLSATFRITITPQPNEANTKKMLVTAQEFTAKDAWTNEDRKEPVPDVLTEKVI